MINSIEEMNIIFNGRANYFFISNGCLCSGAYWSNLKLYGHHNTSSISRSLFVFLSMKFSDNIFTYLDLQKLLIEDKLRLRKDKLRKI